MKQAEFVIRPFEPRKLPSIIEKMDDGHLVLIHSGRFQLSQFWADNWRGGTRKLPITAHGYQNVYHRI